MPTTAETVIYQDGNVSVSKSRVVFGPSTYSTANIASVTMTNNTSGAVIGGLVAALFGAISLMILSTNGSAVACILCFAIAVVMAIVAYNATRYAIMFHTNAGQLRAFVSRNKPYIQEVVNAINDAIIARDEK